jgi:hypothetical protein
MDKTIVELIPHHQSAQLISDPNTNTDQNQYSGFPIPSIKPANIPTPKPSHLRQEHISALFPKITFERFSFPVEISR